MVDFIDPKSLQVTSAIEGLSYGSENKPEHGVWTHKDALRFAVRGPLRVSSHWRDGLLMEIAETLVKRGLIEHMLTRQGKLGEVSEFKATQLGKAALHALERRDRGARRTQRRNVRKQESMRP